MSALHGGTDDRSMAKPKVAIEALYEDIPNTTFDGTNKHSSRVSRPLHKFERKLSIPKPGQAKKSISLPLKNVSQSTTSTFGVSSSMRQTLSTSSTTNDRGRRNSTSSTLSANSHASASHGDSKITPQTALALYSDKLTPYERTEINGYPHIYFFGSEARKKNLMGGEKNTAAYDDDEHFYHVVPHDHVAYRYEVAEKPNLGKGTFGQVIKAYDHKEYRWVALKLVRNEKIYLNQSKEELRILQTLRRQDLNGLYNVVRLFDFFIFRNHMVFSFELLGMNLYQLLKRNNYRGLSSGKILPIARGVLKCLELLFRNRIIHCDIKPENIMLRKNGDTTSIKVGDFGSSCYEQQQKYHYIQSRYYRAPEVLLGVRYGPAIDMWSFGCVLCELATGSPIFVGEDEEDQLAAISETVGEIPNSLLNRAKSGKKGFSRSRGRRAPGSFPLSEAMQGDNNFKDCVKKILEWDPDVRPTPVQIQQHNWLCTRPRRLTRDSQHGQRKPSPSSKDSKDSPKK